MVIIATLLVATGIATMLTVRGRVPRSVPVVLAVMGFMLGAFAVDQPAAATTDCVTTTSTSTTIARHSHFAHPAPIMRATARAGSRRRQR